jgi:hypothetical protein
MKFLNHGAIFTFLCLLVIGVMLPSDGAHGLFSAKSLAFCGAVFSFAASLLFHPILKPESQRLMAFVLLSLLFLALWTLFGVESGALALDQFKVFIITLGFLGMGAYYMHEGRLTFATLLKVVILANFSYSLLKITLGALQALQVINALALMEKLGFRFMSMQIMGNLGRLQTSVDILTPFILYFVLSSESWGLFLSRGFKRLFTFLAWISIAFSFSRFLLACALAAHVAFWFCESRKALFLSLFKASCLLFCLIPLIGPERLYQVVERRFFSDESSRSDIIRKEQIEALVESFYEAPYLGKGMGGFSKEVVRDPLLKYSYEVQWVAFLMQFGILGLLTLLVPPLLLLTKILLLPSSRLKASLFALFCLWLISGFTNPFLISLASGILYTLFYGATLTLFAPTCRSSP